MIQDNFNIIDFQNGRWTIDIFYKEHNRKEISINYKLNGEKYKEKENLITLKLVGSQKLDKNIYNVENCQISFFNKELINILLEKLECINKEYDIQYNQKCQIQEDIKKLLKLHEILDRYDKGNASYSDILNIYNYYADFTSLKIVEIDDLDTLYKKVLVNSQKHLNLFPKDHLFALLSRKTFDYKTDDGELIIKLANNDYTSSELRKYEKEHGPLDPIYNWKNKEERLDYEKDYRALMYASDVLLKDRNFIIRYIDNTIHNPKVLEYVNKDIRNNKTFISHCLKKGYTMEEINYVEDTNNIVINDNCTITIVNDLNINSKKSKTKNKVTARKIDWEKKNKTSLKSGTLGEEIVLMYEIKMLKEANKNDLVNKVKWVSKEVGDGLGYDILSFDPSTEEERYIEVKSTKNKNFSDFHISRNEIIFAVKNSDKYKIYLLNNIDTNNPELLICDIKTLLSKFSFEANDFRVYVDDSKKIDSSKIIGFKK